LLDCFQEFFRKEGRAAMRWRWEIDDEEEKEEFFADVYDAYVQVIEHISSRTISSRTILSRTIF
jgi:hypothetical protein